MKYITPIFASIFMFLAVSFLVGLIVTFVLPSKWAQYEIQIDLLRANIPSLIGAITGGFTATYTFKASLRAKTGRLYRDEKNKK
jgi:hypothetical protein